MRESVATLPRPQPGYTVWLEQQSMAHQADTLIRGVSQTDRIWMFPGQGKNVDILLEAAPQWLQISADNLDSRKWLTELAARASQISLAEFQGLYLGAVGEDQSHWLADDKTLQNSGRLPASLELDTRLGEQRDLERLLEAAEKAGLELGASLPSASTSMGPDFFLQARNVTGHAGLYAMLEIPQNLWSFLPENKGEWECATPSPLQIQELSSRGIIPGTLYRDGYAWAPPAGWAATGEVTGSDGKLRRWLYRYDKNVRFPVMLWQDPSGLARNILSAAVIQQTGFWRMSLTGLHLAALMGLEPHVPEESDKAALTPSFSPGLEALDLLADQIHRYGGWALQADPLPKDLVELVLAGKCDFCREDISESQVRQALISEQVSDLVALFRSWLAQGVEQKRLARGFAPGARMPVSGISDNASEYSFIQEALYGWRLGLPGLAFLPAEDFETNWAGAGLHDSEALIEWRQKLKNVLEMRDKKRLAKGRLVKVLEGGSSSAAVLSALPDRAFWLLATNFGVKQEKIFVKLPERCNRALDVGNGKELSRSLEEDGQKFTLHLDGHEVRHVILYME